MTLRWVAHPFRRRPWRGSLALAAIVAIAVALGLVMRSPFWTLFALAVLGLSLEAFFLPTRYELGGENLTVVKVFSKAETPWARFRRVYEDRYGLTLSPYSRRTFLEPYRSVRLLFDGGARDAICSTVRARMRPEAEWIGPKGTAEQRTGREGASSKTISVDHSGSERTGTERPERTGTEGTGSEAAKWS